MSVINTNVSSLIAQNALSVNNRTLSKTMEQLSTGKRINSAADDAAGLAISNKMTSQIKGLNQAVRNANDGISLLQTAEGATKEITNMLQRIRELTVQASNDTYSDTDRDAISDEVDELKAEITRISENTTWNGMAIFGGDIGNAGTVNFMVGIGTADTVGDDKIDVDMTAIDLAALDDVDLTDYDTASASLASIDEVIVNVDTQRATYGAKINRLTSAADNMANISMNISQSRSRIEDADYATATTELARTQIIQQAATAMLAQANQSSQSVLSLLK